jgi:hypothetical protein
MPRSKGCGRLPGDIAVASEGFRSLHDYLTGERDTP